MHFFAKIFAHIEKSSTFASKIAKGENYGSNITTTGYALCRYYFGRKMGQPSYH